MLVLTLPAAYLIYQVINIVGPKIYMKMKDSE